MKQRRPKNESTNGFRGNVDHDLRISLGGRCVLFFPSFFFLMLLKRIHRNLVRVRFFLLVWVIPCDSYLTINLEGNICILDGLGTNKNASGLEEKRKIRNFILVHLNILWSCCFPSLTQSNRSTLINWSQLRKTSNHSVIFELCRSLFRSKSTKQSSVCSRNCARCIFFSLSLLFAEIRPNCEVGLFFWFPPVNSSTDVSHN